MKKKTLLLGLGAGVIAFGGLALGSELLEDRSERQTLAIRQSTNTISEVEAKRIVSEKTGQTDLTFSKVQLETDDDRINPYYEIEAFKDQTEYDYEVDAVTGEVTSASEEQLTSTSSSPDVSVTSNQSTLTETEIKAKVGEAIGHSDLNYAKLQTSTEDGKQIFKVKVTDGTTTHELELDAQAGSVLSHEKEDTIKTSPSALTASAKLSIDQVKEIVSKSTQASNLVFTEIELSQEKDDYNNRLIYDITAYADGIAYDLDIDATTGEVLKTSAERDND
ncbi:PepSY domain-containing protein [Streptococcus rifensis]